MAFGEIKDHTLRTTLFQEKIPIEILRLCLPYVKRYLHSFSLYGSNNSDSLVLETATFGEIKDHNLRTKRFHKKNFPWKF